MIRTLLTSILCCLYCLSYCAANNSILHYSNTEITIESLNKVIVKESYKVEILNEFEEEVNQLIINYSPENKINSIVVEVATAASKPKKYKKKDFKDYAADGSNLATDNRAIVLRVNENTYPYFISVECEKEIFGTMFMPNWSPQQSNTQLVKAASLIINNNARASLYFINHNISKPTNSNNIYSISVKNVAPFSFEKFNRNKYDYYPVLEINCGNFQFFDKKGSFDSWQTYGKFISHLNENRNTLTSEDLAVLKNEIPVKNAKAEQVKAIYDYLQDNSRYVSVQLGIGGWQPQETGFTHQKKYGDCKALSFYTKSLLNEFDIPAFYTLISAGKYSFDKVNDNPGSNFNHAILTVPVEQDTIWLECTSQTNPFGYLGVFTSDRYALAVNGENSKLIKTKAYSKDENFSESKYYVHIKDASNTNIEIEKKLSGITLSESGLMNFDHLTKTEQNNRLADINTINNFKIEKFTVSPTSDEIVPICDVSIKGEVGENFTVKGNRIFFKLNDFFADQEVYFSESERKKPIYLQYPFTKVDVIFINYPLEYTVEAPVKPDKVKTKYGEFCMEYNEIDANNIMIIRKVVFNKGTYQIDEYEALKTFTKTIKKKDSEMVVFKVK